MIGYQVSKRVSLWAGYTRVEQFSDGRAPAIENRFFEQLSWNVGRIGTASISTRIRLEQRFFENGLGSSLRARQLVKIAVPVKGITVTRRNYGNYGDTHIIHSARPAELR